jgi:hypothetical protein
MQHNFIVIYLYIYTLDYAAITYTTQCIIIVASVLGSLSAMRHKVNFKVAFDVVLCTNQLGTIYKEDQYVNV